MSVILRGVTTVLLPGTGSDDDYVYRAFSTALHEVGAPLVTPPPQPGRLSRDIATRSTTPRGQGRSLSAACR